MQNSGLQKSPSSNDLNKRRRVDSRPKDVPPQAAFATQQPFHDTTSISSHTRVNVIPSTATDADFALPAVLHQAAFTASPNLLHSQSAPRAPSPPGQRSWSASSSHHSAPAMLQPGQLPSEVSGYYTPPLYNTASLYGSSYLNPAGSITTEQYTYVSPTASGIGVAAAPLTPQEPDWNRLADNTPNRYEDAFQAFTASGSSEDWIGNRWPPQ